MNIIHKLKQLVTNKKEQLTTLITFGIVGGFGTILNTGILWALTSLTTMHYLFAAAIATELAIVSNFFGNHFITFRKNDDPQSMWSKFANFQLISLVALTATLTILWALTSSLGIELLLVWNLIAIGITFLLNFGLNKAFTWRSTHDHDKPNMFVRIGKSAKARFVMVTMVVMLLLVATTSAAPLVSVSQLGYHPDSVKQVVVYADASSTTFDIMSGATVVATYPLTTPTDYFGATTSCQGTLNCTVGNFSAFTTPGTYTIKTAAGDESDPFEIKSTIYSDNIDVFNEFFDAMKQQGSSYHDDYHTYHDPAFTAMADGSFIMEADQASLTLIRLGSAYRTNPAIFDTEIQDTIQDYADYIVGLQGLDVQVRTDGVGFRLDNTMKINYAFTPLPINQTTIDVYVNDQGALHPDSPVAIQTLCSINDSNCTDYARDVYKCQIGEVCLDMSYIGTTGVVTATDNGYDVVQGWNYDFGCFLDAPLTSSIFDTSYNSCMVFLTNTDADYTIRALHAYLQAIPAIHDQDPAAAQVLYTRAVATADYIKTTYGPGTGDDLANWGAALFLLYDYSGDSQYLVDAHALAASMPQTLGTFITDGREFYWEEYVRHKTDIINEGLTYDVSGTAPEEFFRGKMFNDYKDIGSDSISANGERVYQVFKDTRFSNARPILIEGLQASKTVELHPTPEPFISEIADNQLAWITGMNGIQDGVSVASRANITHYSFIFGIGTDTPTEYHSRLLIDTGLTSRTSGSVIGTRGSSLLFEDPANPGDYVYFDGRQHLLGDEYGSLGNLYNNETQIDPWDTSKVFNNGKTVIEGWINGPFDVTDNEPDTIYNYDDTLNTYEFTETTNEMVAVAIELFAHRDAMRNGRARHAGVFLGNTTPGNQTNTTTNATLNITSLPTNLDLFINSVAYGVTPQVISVAPGIYNIQVVNASNASNQTNVNVAAGEYKEVFLTLQTGNTTPGNQTNTSVFVYQNTNVSQNSTGHYPLFETDTGLFEVMITSIGTVEWKVNGVLTDTTTGTVNHAFTWNPGILYAGVNKDEPATITATSSGETITWNIIVREVINPYADPYESGAGDPQPLIHVVTQNYAITPIAVNVSVYSEDSGQLTTYQLSDVLHFYELDWTVTPNLIPGQHYIREITIKEATGTTVYNLGNTRGIVRTPFFENDEDNKFKPSSGGGGGGGGGGVSSQLTLVYSLFDKDVLHVEAEQSLLVDLSIVGPVIEAAQARIITPDGRELMIELELTQGSGSYGTWEADFEGFITGEYILDSIDVTYGNGGKETVDEQDRSFYAVSEEVGVTEQLGLVYTLISEGVVDKDDTVTITLDARDATGITLVKGTIENERAETITLEFERIAGDGNYGTWEASFPAAQEDSTYELTEVVLSNGEQTTTHEIIDRSVYVNYIEPDLNSLTGAATAASTFSTDAIIKLLRKPLVPTLIGFTLMFVVLLTLLFNKRLRSRLDLEA